MTIQQAKALAGKTVTLGGKKALVKEWRSHHPLSEASPETDDKGLAGPIQMESDPSGWLKVCIETAAPSSGQWWRYSVLERVMD